MRSKIKYFAHWLLTCSLVILLSACGSSSDDSSSNSSSSLSGTAAVGAAIGQKMVTAIDAEGVQTTTITGADGKFTIEVNASSKPYMLKVTTGGGETLFSFAEKGGDVANITPMTNLALQEMNKDNGTYEALDALFSSFKTKHAQALTTKKIANAKGLVNATFNSLLTANGVSTQVDFFKTAFDADSTKIDKVLDGIEIVLGDVVANGTSAISIKIGTNPASPFDSTIDFSQFIPGGGNGGGTSSVPDIAKGNIIVMTFDFLSDGQTGPVALNTDVAFTFSSSGALFINLDNTGLDEITIPSSLFSESNGDYIWQDQNNDFKYVLSLTSNDDIHEINVFKLSDDTFIGQFGTLVSNSGSGGGTGSSSDGMSLTVDGGSKAFESNITVGFEQNDSVIVVTANSSAGGTMTFRTPNGLGAFTCNIAISSDGTYVTNSSSTCTGNVSSLSPFSATYSGTIFNLSTFQNTEVSNGTLNVANMPENPAGGTGDAAIPDGEFGIAFKADGATHTRTIEAGNVSGIALAITGLGDQRFLAFNGTGIFDQLRMIPINQTGTYTCGQGPSSFRLVEMWLTFNTSTQYKADSTVGSCTIVVNQVGDVYSGTFSATVVKNSDSIAITDGVFKVDGSAL